MLLKYDVRLSLTKLQKLKGSEIIRACAKAQPTDQETVDTQTTHSKISLETVQLHHACCSVIPKYTVFTESLRSWNNSLDPRYYAKTEHNLHMPIFNSSLELSDDPYSYNNVPESCYCNNFLTIFCFH